MTLKEQLLARLESQRGESVSGQELAEQYGVSRNAVWKAIGALKQEGYAIESSTNRGYRLAEDCDRLSAAAIKAALSDPAVPVYAVSSVDSTNEEARRRLSQSSESCFVVVAEEQTAGRGRRGRAFYSPRDTGLYLTLAMAPDTTVAQLTGVTAYAAVCTARAIREVCGKQPRIKWVNDLFLDGRKIGGILTEAISDVETGQVSHLMIGVGVNLRAGTVPDELSGVMGFVDADGGAKNRLAAAIVNGLLRYDPADTGFMEDYRRWSMVLGRGVTYEQNDQTRVGVATAIDDHGALEIRHPDGSVAHLRSGEITLRVNEQKK